VPSFANASSAIYKIVCLSRGDSFPENDAGVDIDMATAQIMQRELERLKTQADELVAKHWKSSSE
jgi:hypothetical protein